MEVTRVTLAASFTRRFPAGPVIRADLRVPGDRFSITVLFGPSGSGKTTVLRCLAGLDRPDEGVITFGHERWFDAALGVRRPPQQRAIGYLSQDYALFPHLTVEGNLGYGLQAPRPERQARIAHLVELFSLKNLEARYPRQLSGGQQQRVALARALIRRPRLLLLDEPLSALDLPTRESMRAELRHWLANTGVPAVIVTHDRTEALALGDQVVVLDAGQVFQAGPVLEVFNRPASAAVARLVGVETIEPARVLKVVDGLATLVVGPLHLTAIANDAQPGDAFVCIRGEDVVLTKDTAPTSSARNRLPATVSRLVREGPLVRVHLDSGIRLTALVTSQSCHELSLEVGSEVTALIKAPAIHIVTRN